jgi:hypothetical protein
MHDVTMPGGPLEGHDKALLLRATLHEWDVSLAASSGPRERAFFSALRAVLAECDRASPLQVRVYEHRPVALCQPRRRRRWEPGEYECVHPLQRCSW